MNQDPHRHSPASTAAAAAAAAAAAVMNHVSSADPEHGSVSSTQAKQAVAIAAAAAAQATAHSMGVPDLAAMAENGAPEHSPSEEGVKKKTRKRKPRTGPANFICDVEGCGKAFRMQGDLQTHMRKHTGDEPFVCSFPNCGRRYKWRSSLSHHEGLHRKSKDLRVRRRVRKPNSNNSSISVAMSTPAHSSINVAAPSNIPSHNNPSVPMQQVVHPNTNNHFQMHSPMASVGSNTQIAIQHLSDVDNILSRGATAIIPRPQSSLMVNSVYAASSHPMHGQIPMQMPGNVSMPILQHQSSQGQITSNHLLQAHQLSGNFAHQNQPWHSHVSLDSLQQGQYLKKEHLLQNHLVMHCVESTSVPPTDGMDKSHCALNTHEGLSDVPLPVATNSLPTSNAPLLGDPSIGQHIQDASRLTLNSTDFHTAVESHEFQGAHDQGSVLSLGHKPSPIIGTDNPMLSQREPEHNEPADNRYSHSVPDLQSNQITRESASRELQQSQQLIQQPKESIPENTAKPVSESQTQRQHKEMTQTNSSSPSPEGQTIEQPARDHQQVSQHVHQSDGKAVTSNDSEGAEGACEPSKYAEPSQVKTGDGKKKKDGEENTHQDGPDRGPTSANSSTDPTSEHAS